MTPCSLAEVYQRDVEVPPKRRSVFIATTSRTSNIASVVVDQAKAQSRTFIKTVMNFHEMEFLINSATLRRSVVSTSSLS
jgi:hypothetical protein